jgi:hypothetical protein
MPYPAPDKDTVLWASLGYIAGAAIQIARQDGIILRWGGDWNKNGQISDETFHDLFHLEIVEIAHEENRSYSSLPAGEFRLRD